MRKFDSVDDVLDFAVENEIRAQDFYTELAGQMERPAMKAAFLEFAAEERKHEELLRRVKDGHQLDAAAEQVANLRISDYLVDADTTPAMSYQEALILAIKREQAAMILYSDLAASTADRQLRKLFEGLAQEEAKHKLRFETEYDEHVFKEN